MKPPKPPRAKPRAVRILLVDDHPVVRDGLAEMLNRHPGFEVCGEAEDREHALALIETRKPDLAIIDLALKGSSGLDLLKDIRARHPQMRLLVLSMLDETVYAERALRAGAAGYVTKHEAAAKILSAIQRVLEGGIYLSDRVTSQLAASLAGRPRGAVVESLTNRELQVFELIGEGLGTRHIAGRLRLSAGTVETYRARIKVKLQLKDANALLRCAIRWHRGQGL